LDEQNSQTDNRAIGAREWRSHFLSFYCQKKKRLLTDNTARIDGPMGEAIRRKNHQIAVTETCRGFVNKGRQVVGPLLQRESSIAMKTSRALPAVLLRRLIYSQLFLFALAYAQQGKFRVAPIVADNMVVQQQSDVPLWGYGIPATLISVKASWGATASVRVGPDGTWRVNLKTPKAGGPYRIVFGHDDTSTTITNVLAGEVWLCSGQSNMEMPLAGWPPNDTVMNSGVEIAHATLPNIRLFTVKRAFSAVPESDCVGEWSECSPKTSRAFSATAFYFGKKLFETLHVPIGLIHSSWGGTRIQSWIDADYLSKLPQYDTTLQKVRASADGQRRMVGWLHGFPVIDMRAREGENRWAGLSFQDEHCPDIDYNDSSWQTMRLPTYWEETSVGEFDGVVWFRKQVVIPQAWVHKDLVINLGPIDDIDITFVNGAKVGSHEREGAWQVERRYDVPGALVDSTVVEVAVRVIDLQGGGGIYGKPQSMVIHPAGDKEGVSLAGDWKYVPVADYFGDVLYVFGPSGNSYETRPRLPIGLSANTPTALYNGMIAPIVPYGIRGAIWYQGEANTDNPQEYKTLFPLLIENWRHNFKEGAFPFYFVQIAPYDYGSGTHSEYLREAQMATLSVKNTGMAVTLDIGNPQNIHPTNKRDVGERLACWALAKTYKKVLPFSGPMYTSMRKLKRTIELSFAYAAKGLVLTGGKLGNGFQIAGADRVFRNAYVLVRGSKLIVSHPDVRDPEAVRYAFTNTSPATLYNTAGLPASSFRTDDWK
jgi:sialate O-acetylesterase